MPPTVHWQSNYAWGVGGSRLNRVGAQYQADVPGPESTYNPRDYLAHSAPAQRHAAVRRELRPRRRDDKFCPGGACDNSPAIHRWGNWAMESRGNFFTDIGRRDNGLTMRPWLAIVAAIDASCSFCRFSSNSLKELSIASMLASHTTSLPPPAPRRTARGSPASFSRSRTSGHRCSNSAAGGPAYSTPSDRAGVWSRAVEFISRSRLSIVRNKR